MNDEKGLALFALSVVRGYRSLKKNPLWANQEVAMLSDRYGCNTLEELERKLYAYVEELQDHA